MTRPRWARGEWCDRAGKVRREYRLGRWLVSEGQNAEKAKEGLPWALTGPGHETYHRNATEAKQALPKEDVT